MSTSPDKNYLSFSGDASGNIWRNGELIVSGPRSDFVTIDVGDVIPPDDSYADTLKISGVVRANFTVGHVVGSREDCIDVNHSHEIGIVVNTVEPRGKYCMTIKGGSSGISVTVNEQIGHGTETDYDLGNFTEASQDKTNVTEITVLSVHAARAAIRIINASEPHYVLATSYTFKPWWGRWPFWNIYCWLRLHNIVPA